MSAIIVYFSTTGNTETVATRLAATTNFPIKRLLPAEPYPTAFDEKMKRWHQERDHDLRPAITTTVDLSAYDTIYLGYPIWSNNLPAIPRTFLEAHDWTGKNIIPFCTNGGSGFGQSLDRIRQLAAAATILPGFEIYNTQIDHSASLETWLESQKQSS
ncbi:flavodoxin [Levilactobacillus enshiensis]|uniref:flavodoxin n=1 Tax=Levilactobacillus enshiensis TaxID=2590213 RepID=UPI00117AE557|nr:flavodoxin [Levilactobacillus enshiensis]